MGAAEPYAWQDMVSMGVGVAAGDGQHPAPLKMDEPYKCLDSPPAGAKQVLAITQPVRSANNVIQPSLDESPPASPTDKNLHSSDSTAADLEVMLRVSKK